MLNGVLLKKLVVPQLVKKVPHFMEPEGSLPWIPGVWDAKLSSQCKWFATFRRNMPLPSSGVRSPLQW